MDYVVSANGPGDVLGGDAPKIADLDPCLRDKLLRIAAKHAPDSHDELRFLLLTDLVRCDEETLAVPSIVTSGPQEPEGAHCALRAFVAAKALERCPAVRITCNCGHPTDYRSADGTSVVRCERCRTGIGLLGISGDGSAVAMLNPDGSPGSAPIQGRDRFSVPGVAVG